MQHSLIKKNRINKVLVIIVPILLIFALIFLKDYIVLLAQSFPACPFRTLSGYYCPGCGNTRSILHLLDGDIVGALQYNIVPIILLVILILLYIEWVSIAFLKHKKILPRNNAFWITFVSVVMVYLIFRNFIPALIP